MIYGIEKATQFVDSFTQIWPDLGFFEFLGDLGQDVAVFGDQTTDAAGRASSPQGAAQSSVGKADAHQLEEDRFAASAADLLKRRALSNDFKQLIVIAPPRTLGELRKHYHMEVSDRITGELAKDLTGHPIPDIERAIVDA